MTIFNALHEMLEFRKVVSRWPFIVSRPNNQ